MTYEEAIKILHPNTTLTALAELNKLIAKHEGTKAGKTPDKNIKP